MKTVSLITRSIIAATLLLTTLVSSLNIGLSTAASAASVNAICSSSGHLYRRYQQYNCKFWQTAPVEIADRIAKGGWAFVGSLHAGTDWVVCGRTGAARTVNGHTNRHWAYTVADNGHAGWVNAVYASGGTDKGGFSIPACTDSFLNSQPFRSLPPVR